MKAKRLLSFLAIFALVLGLVSCKDKNNGGSTPSSNSTKKYFTVEGAAYVSSSFPKATSDVELDVNMNSTALAGGSAYATVASPVPADKILVGVSGVSGYYEIDPELRSDKEILYDLILVFNQSLNVEEFVVTIAILDEDGEVSQTYDVVMELVTAGTGRLQVSLSFDTPKDVDLILIEPNGEWVYYGNPYSENGGMLDVDSNAACDIDNINNENIFYGDDAYVEPGEYTVYVDMYENCNTDYATNFVLTVFYNGSMIETIEGINPIAGTFAADEPSNWTELDNIAPVCHFVIPGDGPAKSGDLQKKGPKFLRSINK